jgi:glutamate dehydrogenase/leucine dehydrogenase
MHATPTPNPYQAGLLPPLQALSTANHQAVLFCNDNDTGLKGYIALHNTALGPGLGGCRMMVYPSEQAALADVLALSQAMTYKNALAGLNYGGGKAVMWLTDPSQKTPSMVQALARCIDLLRGSYYTATDIGSTSHDMKLMRDITPYVSALAPEHGGLGDSATLTGYGVYRGIQAAVAHQRGDTSLKGLRVAIQGTGKVASHLIGYLLEEGCHLTVTDTHQPTLEVALKRFPTVQAVAPEAIWQIEADILSPNAIGGTLTAEVILATKATMVVGGANNPLANASVAQLMKERGILYAPDFAVNSGGVIQLSAELAKQSVDDARAHTAGIFDTALAVFARAEQDDTTTLQAAIALATERINAASQA